MAALPSTDPFSVRWPWLRPEHLVAAIAFFVFLPSIATGFVYDDVPLIVQNEFVHSTRWLARPFTTHVWDVSRIADADAIRGVVDATRRYYRPLVTVSYLLTWVTVGARAWVFHLFNVVLHAVTAGLATRAAHRWIPSARLAFAVGVLFAIHPSRTENVIWVAGRTDTLMLFFMLLALEALQGFSRSAAQGQPRWGLVAGGVLALLAAILSKEPAAMLPFLMLADRTAAPDVRSKTATRVMAGVVFLCVAYVVGRAVFWSPEGDEVRRTFTPMHFVVTVGTYVQRMIVPWPPTMYYRTLEFRDGTPHYSALLVVLGVVAIVGALLFLRLAWKRNRTSFWLFVAGVAFMGPLLNVYFTGMSVTAQDRFLYAPSFFVSAALASLFAPRLEALAERRATLLATIGLALGAVILVEIRMPDYRSEKAFWDAELEHGPDHPHLLRMRARCAASEGNLEEANRYFIAANQSTARYSLATGALLRVSSHFQQAVIAATLLPDGRVEELRAILDELWRLVDRTWQPPRRTVLDVEIGGPLDDPTMDRLVEARSLQWDVALIATRLGDFERATKAVATTSSERLLTAGNPLNGALVLARLGRMDEARAVPGLMLQHAGDLAGVIERADLTGFERRLDRADAFARQKAAAPDEIQRAVYEALRLAELGAYLAAVRTLERAGALDVPPAAPLVTQLLVACRLEDAARTVGGAPAVRALAAELPPPLRVIPPVPGDLQTVLRRARAPFPGVSARP